MIKIKNVILLIVDSLKKDYLKIAGNPLNICPTINTLAEKGIYFSSARSHGFPSQMSFPSILSATLPLDYGGYDRGVKDRPTTLASILRDRGLKTIGYSSSPWLGTFFGYDRGFDEFYELFDVEKFWKIFSTVYYRYYRELFKKRVIRENDFHGIVRSLFDRHLKEMIRLCKNKQEEYLCNVFPYHEALYRYNFTHLVRTFQNMHAEFLDDSENFIFKNEERLSSDDILHFSNGRENRHILGEYVNKIVSRFLELFWIQVRRREHSIQAPYLRRLICNSIVNNREPFFVWSHFLDLHDNVYSSGTLGFPPDFFSLGLQRLFNKGNPARPTSIFCLRFIDGEIAKIMKTLKSNNVLDSTLLIVSGDHGISEVKDRGVPGSLFDEAVRVPLIFYNPQFEHSIINQNFGLKEITSTILDLLEGDGCFDSCKKSLIQKVSTEQPIILETLGAGPGDLNFKAIKISIIQGKYKLIFREPGYENSCPLEQNCLFDLEKDPEELNNLYNNKQYLDIIHNMESFARKRCENLRKSHTKSLRGKVT